MTKLIEREKSVIVAADIQKVETLSKLVKHTCQVKGIGGQGRKDHSQEQLDRVLDYLGAH